jgi:Lrp/AsnC family leucine-responsive transcriptional regulator
MVELDEINKEILRLLCEDSRYQYTQIQKKLKKKGHTLSHRVKKMIENGTIKQFAMITDPEKLGYKICVHMAINLAGLDKDEIGFWQHCIRSLSNKRLRYRSKNLF